MSTLTEELARLSENLSSETTDAMQRLTDALNEVLDDLPALENVAVYGRDREILGEHLENLRTLRMLRREFEGSAERSRPTQ
jgi:hypothetical protein